MRLYVCSKITHIPMWINLRDTKNWPIISQWIDIQTDGTAIPEEFENLWDTYIFPDLDACTHGVALIQRGEVLKGGAAEMFSIRKAGKPLAIATTEDPAIILQQYGSWLHTPQSDQVRFFPSLTDAKAWLDSV